MAPRALGVIGALLLAVLAGFYQYSLKYTLETSGVWRKVNPIGNTGCETVPALQACEKIVLHQPSGVLWLGCSTPANRRAWTPALNRLDGAGSGSDYLATYDPQKRKVTRLTLTGFVESRKFSSHGLDVVSSSTNPGELWVYAINHRKPLKGWDATKVGADSVVEIFKGGLGSNTLQWVKTVNSQHLHTPNEIVGDSDGQGFYWTNDHGSSNGLMRSLEQPLRMKSTSVGYCHITKGCKIVVSGLRGSNGLASNGNGTYYVGSILGEIQSFERQKDNSLTEVDYIKLDRGIDNLSLDADGALYAGGFPKMFDTLKHFESADHKAASSALRITKNTGHDSFFGEKYKVDTVFEDDGSLMPPLMSVAVDAQRNRMFLHGLTCPHLLICDAP